MPPIGSAAIVFWRSSAVIAPIREEGGRISVFCTIEGTPLSSSVETSASPTASCVIASKQEKSGLGRKVSAAALTALVSRGVKARSAC